MLAYTVISLALASLAFSAPVSTPRPILTAANITNATQTSSGSWYYQNGRAGACGNFSTDADFVVGLPLEFYNVTSQVSDLCGSYIIVTNPLTNLTVTARVADASGINNLLTLSVATYKALTGDESSLNVVNWVFANQAQLSAIFDKVKEAPIQPESSSKSASVIISSSTEPKKSPSPTSSTTYSSSSYSSSSSSSSKESTTSTTTSSESSPSSLSSTYKYVETSSTSTYSTKTSTSVYVGPTSTDVSLTSTYAAPTPTYVAPAPVKTSAPSSGQFSGKATYYNQEGGTGSCGKVFPDSAYIVAIQAGMYDGAKCGDSLKITRTKTGKTITAIMADKCPGCPSRESIDLSVGAFSALADLGDGLLDVTWSWE